MRLRLKGFKTRSQNCVVCSYLEDVDYEGKKIKKSRSFKLNNPGDVSPDLPPQEGYRLLGEHSEIMEEYTGESHSTKMARSPVNK